MAQVIFSNQHINQRGEYKNNFGREWNINASKSIWWMPICRSHKVHHKSIIVLFKISHGKCRRYTVHEQQLHTAPWWFPLAARRLRTNKGRDAEMWIQGALKTGCTRWIPAVREGRARWQRSPGVDTMLPRNICELHSHLFVEFEIKKLWTQ